MQFVYQAGAEQCVGQFAAAFAQQALDSPLAAQPAQGRREIDFLRAAYPDLGPQRAQPRPPPRRGALRREHENRGKGVLENAGRRIHAAGAAHDDAEIELRQPAPLPQAAVFQGPRPQVNRV